MIIIRPKAPWQKFSKSLVQIKHVQFIIDDLNAASVHKPQQKERYLLESYIVYLIALWEAFIEDCFDDATTLLPASSVAGNAKTVIKNFSSPNTDGIKRLTSNCFLDTLDIPGCWGWPGFTNSQVLSYLNHIMKIRHGIAHAGFSEARLVKQLNFNYMMFLCNIAVQTQNLLTEFMTAKGICTYQLFDLPYPNLKPNDMK